MSEPRTIHEFNPREHTLEGKYLRGTPDFDQALRAVTFRSDDLGRAHAVRVWHPYYRDGLSSFIYHYHDLLDARGTVIAQALDAEDIREG